MGSSIAELIHLIFTIFNLLILGRVLLGWINLDPYHPVAQFLYRTTEPFLEPIRRVMPSMGMFDLSPIVVIIIAAVLENILVQLVR
ncbi:MAG: YggT family protein [Anaerolineae bacterium]|nr:YggT family protein [Anaerolineae bacterium]